VSSLCSIPPTYKREAYCILNLAAKTDNNNSIYGSIVTDSEILGYTASVGGCIVKATPYGISVTTNIYGEFQLNNLPVGDYILEIESSYFQSFTKSIQVGINNNEIGEITIFTPKCQNVYTQSEVDQKLTEIRIEKDAIIKEKNATIALLNKSMASMYSQEYLNNAIIEAEKIGELKYDINNDGKVGLEEVIKYLETLSGIRIESLIIYPDNNKHFLSE